MNQQVARRIQEVERAIFLEKWLFRPLKVFVWLAVTLYTFGLGVLATEFHLGAEPGYHRVVLFVLTLFITYLVFTNSLWEKWCSDQHLLELKDEWMDLWMYQNGHITKDDVIARRKKRSQQVG